MELHTTVMVASLGDEATCVDGVIIGSRRRLVGGRKIVIDTREEPIGEVGERVEVGYQADGGFWRQPFRITASREVDGIHETSLIATEKALYAESRAEDRIDTSTDQVRVKVNHLAECFVINVSHEGFAMVSNQNYVVNQALNIQLTCSGGSFADRATVCHSQQIGDNTWLYGCHADAESELAKGLRRLCMSLRFKHAQAG